MSRPTKHKKTGVYYFRKAVPKDLRPILGWEVKESLGTKDPSEARELYAEKAAETAVKWKALRSEPAALTHKEIVALSGIAYQELIEIVADDPGPVGVWENLVRIHRSADTQEKLEQWLGTTVDDVLLRRGLKADRGSREKLLEETNKAVIQAAEQKMREASGDYRTDPDADRFPVSEDVASKTNVRPKAAECRFADLVEGWWDEARAAGRTLSTYESYRNTLARFAKFLGHDNAASLTPEDVIAFKDHRLREVNPKTGKPVSPKTIKDSDLAALKSVFGWALRNRRLGSNPADNITVAVPKKTRLRPKGFTDDEAEKLLAAALELKQGKERSTTFFAKKWVPWLCAYTGARVGEMVQLRGEDLFEDGGEWVVTITPEAGTVKNKETRTVALHAHLIELGFPEFVKKQGRGYLFLSSSEGDEIRGRWRSTKNRVTEFVRTIITDPNVAPNHGWRHRFKTVALEVGMDPRIREYIQGHSGRTEGDDYGDNTPKAQARELAKMPAYKV